MLRLFETHVVRKQTELEGMWEFSVDEGQCLKYYLTVPGCWEQHPGLRTYRGRGIYKKKIFLTEKTNLCLIFKGVSHTCEIWFDGECVGSHYNAYTPFEIYLSNISYGEHELRICVDNSFSENSALHIANDYYTYGGITRPVAIEYLSDAFIENVNFTPKWNGNIWSGEIAVCVRNLTEKHFSGELKSFIADYEEISFGKITLAPLESKMFTVIVNFPGVTVWKPDAPMLYYLNTQLFNKEQLIDDYIDRVGFRRIEKQGRKILLNGEEIFLKGFNRHEDHTIFGCALPLQVMAEDVELILQTGANAIRTSHYPNDERFLDMCDERGILVWEENHARGLSLEQMMNPNFDRQCRDCIQEMIINHYNHPSIIIWGILNECASDTEIGKNKYRLQFEQIKEIDTSRLTTFATCRHFTDICLDLPDVVSTNIYPLWYDNVTPMECLEKELEWIHDVVIEEKPVIVSETGAGGIYGYRSDTCVKWTEERQAMILEGVLMEYVNNPELAGIFIWQFCDCRVTEEKWFSWRPKTCNNKGIVDGYRRKKLAYEVVKRYYKEW